jgi:hypothetical protein
MPLRGVGGGKVELTIIARRAGWGKKKIGQEYHTWGYWCCSKKKSPDLEKLLVYFLIYKVFYFLSSL